MGQARLRLPHWTALLGAVFLACAVLLFQVAHVTAAPLPEANHPAAAMPCHGEADAGSSKAKGDHLDRSCAMHCTALFLTSMPLDVVRPVPVVHEGGHIVSLSSREPPAPERPPKG